MDEPDTPSCHSSAPPPVTNFYFTWSLFFKKIPSDEFWHVVDGQLYIETWNDRKITIKWQISKTWVSRVTTCWQQGVVLPLARWEAGWEAKVETPDSQYDGSQMLNRVDRCKEIQSPKIERLSAHLIRYAPMLFVKGMLYSVDVYLKGTLSYVGLRNVLIPGKWRLSMHGPLYKKSDFMGGLNGEDWASDWQDSSPPAPLSSYPPRVGVKRFKYTCRSFKTIIWVFNTNWVCHIWCNFYPGYTPVSDYFYFCNTERW